MEDKEEKKEYRCSTTSEPGFLRRLCQLLPYGYWWYVQDIHFRGRERRDKRFAARLAQMAHDELDVLLRETDQMFIDKYHLTENRRVRCYRRSKNVSSMAYVRFGREYVLFCTQGLSLFRQSVRLGGESVRDTNGRETRIRDVRYNADDKTNTSLHKPIVFSGYSVRCVYETGKWRCRPQMARPVYQQWRAYYLNRARNASVGALHRELLAHPYEPYRGVRLQLHRIADDANKVLKQRGMKHRLVTKGRGSCIAWKRRRLNPFDPIAVAAKKKRAA